MTESATPSAGVFKMAVALRFGVNNLFNILTSLNGSVARKFCPNCTAVLSGGFKLCVCMIIGRNRNIQTLVSTSFTLFSLLIVPPCSLSCGIWVNFGNLT